jgi:hypothetical protein
MTSAKGKLAGKDKKSEEYKADLLTYISKRVDKRLLDVENGYYTVEADELKKFNDSIQGERKKLETAIELNSNRQEELSSNWSRNLETLNKY